MQHQPPGQWGRRHHLCFQGHGSRLRSDQDWCAPRIASARERGANPATAPMAKPAAPDRGASREGRARSCGTSRRSAPAYGGRDECAHSCGGTERLQHEGRTATSHSWSCPKSTIAGCPARGTTCGTTDEVPHSRWMACPVTTGTLAGIGGGSIRWRRLTLGGSMYFS